MRRMICAVSLAAGLATGPVLGSAIEYWCASGKGPHPKGVSIESDNKVIKLKLEGLKPETKIHWARLYVFRDALPVESEDRLKSIEICPLKASFSDTAPTDKALSLASPWFDHFDVTALTKAWLAKPESNFGLLVKTCPKWKPDRTSVMIAHGGTPKDPPPPVKDLSATHRSGQTFLTWKEIRTPAFKEPVAWKSFRNLLAKGQDPFGEKYCVFRSEKPITAETLGEASLIAIVDPLSCWNVNARNIEKAVDDALANQYSLIHGHWNPFARASLNGAYGQDYMMERLVVREGSEPLTNGTGLYVHTTTKGGKAHYAVLSCRNGSVNTNQIVATAEAVAETVAEPQPVLQGEIPPRPFWNFPETRLHYVRWVAPPHGNLPYQYFNWAVGVPKQLGKSVPMELLLHKDDRSYYRTNYRIERDSIVLMPHDFPLKTWWYGYHESLGTLRSLRQGAVHNYTEKRLLWFVDWAAKKWPAVDRGRILVTSVRRKAGGPGKSGYAAGCSGAIHLALRHPNVFSFVNVGSWGYAEYKAMAGGDVKPGSPGGELAQLFGKPEWEINGVNGKPVWDEFNLVGLASSASVGTDFPFVAVHGGRKAGAKTRELFKAVHDKGQPIMVKSGRKFVPISRTNTWPDVIRMDIRKNKLLPVFRHAKLDSCKYWKRSGVVNRRFRWDSGSVVDKADRCEVVLRVTRSGSVPKVTGDVILRCRQAFKVVKGDALHWEALAGDDGKTVVQKGDLTVGDDGLLVVPGVELTEKPVRLVVTKK